MSISVWYQQITEQNKHIQNEFKRVSDGYVERLSERFQIYEYGLRGTRGAIIAAGRGLASRHSFEEYFKSRDLAREFPGAKGMGFIQRVEPHSEKQFVESARLDGHPNFSIREMEPRVPTH